MAETGLHGGRQIEPASGKTVTLYDVRFTYKVESTDSRGELSILETLIPPRTLVKPHTHTREDEFSLVLDGTVGVRLGDEEFEAPRGTYLVKPRGIPHAVWNAGDEPVTLVEIISPAGFEQYFEEIAPVLNEHGPEWTQRYRDIAERYGITVLDDWSDELQERYGVHL